MVAPHAALAKCPVGYVRLWKPVHVVISPDHPDIRSRDGYEPNAAAPASATAWS
jgi:hypothetical protein